MKAFLRGIRCERKVETDNKPSENLSGRKNLSTACRNERLEEQQKKEEKTSNDEKYGETEEIASKGCGKSKNNEKIQEKELGLAEREDHHRAEGPTIKTVLGNGDARPELVSRWWPAHRCCASDNG